MHIPDSGFRLLLCAVLLLPPVAAAHTALPALRVTAGADAGAPAWAVALEQRLQEIDGSLAGGDIGVYVLHMERNESYAYRAEEPWYLASGVKVPIAIAVMREVERGGLSLDTQVVLRSGDFVDGAGSTNRHRAGDALAVSYLLGQMIVHSDNTASDVLIRTVGLDQVNRVAAELVDARLHITTLADVRRLAYGQFHRDAAGLTSADLLALKQQPAGPARVRRLAGLLGVPQEQFGQPDLTAAFEAYYATGANSGTLVDFGRMLATLADGEALGAQATAWLLDLMLRVETGRQRIRAGLPPGVAFAHKTGTQYRRTCDLGIAMQPADPPARMRPDRVVIAACVRGTGTAAGERALRRIAAAITAAGVFVDTPPQPTVSPPAWP